MFLRIPILIFSLFSLHASAQSGSARVFHDVKFTQEYAIIYSTPLETQSELSLAADQNGNIQILNKHQLLKPSGGYFQDWGNLVADQSYLPMKDKKIAAIFS